MSNWLSSSALKFPRCNHGCPCSGHDALRRPNQTHIIAGTGGDMATFDTAAQLASCAGTVPGSNESACRIRSTKTRPGNPYLKAALGKASMSVSRSRTTYFSAKYHRIAARRGPIRALVAVQHSMLLAIWHILTTGEVYCDPGPDYYTRRRPAQAVRRAIALIQSFGFNVSIDPAIR